MKKDWREEAKANGIEIEYRNNSIMCSKEGEIVYIGFDKKDWLLHVFANCMVMEKNKDMLKISMACFIESIYDLGACAFSFTNVEDFLLEDIKDMVLPPFSPLEKGVIPGEESKHEVFVFEGKESVVKDYFILGEKLVGWEKEFKQKNEVDQLRVHPHYNGEYFGIEMHYRILGVYGVPFEIGLGLKREGLELYVAGEGTEYAKTSEEMIERIEDKLNKIISIRKLERLFE